jgi:hypothetical protein
MIKKYFVILFVLIVSSNLFAQDTQYWAKQYGTYGELLGGVVVGGISDLSATYYNPGSMAFVKDSTLVLTTHSIQAYLLSLENAFGTGISLTSSSVKTSQGIFAFRLRFDWLGDNQIVLSYISRYDFSFNVQEAEITPFASTKVNYNSTDVLAYEDLAEYWFGATWSKKISNFVGLGATLYFPYRSQKIRNQVITQKRDSTNTNSSIIIFEDFSYKNVRTLIKFGLSIDLTPLMLGITITTPSINIYGTGETGMNIVATNINDSDLAGYPNFVSDFQEDLTSKYFSPLSIAVGTSYYLDNTSFYFTAEWFNKVDEFNIIESKPFYTQSSAEKITYDSKYQLRSIVNFGIGIKHVVSRDFIFYGSITSDQTAFAPNTVNKFALSNWDIIHVRSGGMFNIDNFSITLGLGYGFTGNLYNGLNIFGFKDMSASSTKYHQLDVVFGLTYNLN